MDLILRSNQRSADFPQEKGTQVKVGAEHRGRDACAEIRVVALGTIPHLTVWTLWKTPRGILVLSMGNTRVFRKQRPGNPDILQCNSHRAFI